MNNTTPRRCGKASEAGYLLVSVMFMLAILVIAMSVAAPRIAKSIQRDRELETMHRGKQYARAVKLYYKKFGAYPPNLDALVKTNEIRFLRKKYVDPTTGKDEWKPVRYGQNKAPTAMGFFGQPLTGAGMGGGGLCGNALPSSIPSSGSSSTFGGSSSSFGSSGSSFGSSSSSFGSSSSSFGSSSSSFGSSSSSFGSSNPMAGCPPTTDNSNTSASNTSGANTAGGNANGSTDPNAANGSTDPNNPNAGQNSGSGTTNGSSTPGAGTGTGIGTGTGTGTGLTGQQFGGGAIIGFSPNSPKQSILVYKKKNHFNEWEFVYDPIAEQLMQQGGAGGNGLGGNGLGGNGTGGFGNNGNGGFGNNGTGGFGNNGTGGFGNNGGGFGSGGGGFGSSGGGFGSSGGSGTGSGTPQPPTQSPQPQ